MESQQSPLKKLSLQRSRTEGAFSIDESLWWDREIRHIFRLLKQHLRSLNLSSSKDQKRGSKKEDQQAVLAMAIVGDHGSGKSSLLKTLEACFRKRKSSDLEEEEALQGVHCLPILKPNLQDDHLLYAFLAAALEDNRPDGQADRSASILTPLQREVQEISEYLQVVNPEGSNQENDPLGISLERLDRHSSSLLLSEKMNSLIKVMADSLAGNSLVLMPVDDADASMRSFARILDTCQRYLMHPRLVPIITFNPSLAEEFLVMHFSGEMVRGAAEHATKQTYDLAKVKALQDLAKLFPERNRIHLRPVAVARLLGTRYAVEGPDGTKREYLEVLKMLRRASRLLFGSYQEHEEEVRKPLRPSSLRRQLQIVDAMDAVGVGKFVLDCLAGPKSNRTIEYPRKWIEFFDAASWTLIDLYRDILRQVAPDLEEIVGWTPIILRTTLLNRILDLDLATRRKLLTYWRFSSDDVYSQVLSLLAVTVFRPRMAKEPPWGDNTRMIEAWVNFQDRHQAAEGKGGAESKDEGGKSLKLALDPVEAAILAKRSLLWFLHLWLGFYLPQVLVRNRAFGSAKDGCVEALDHRVTGIGWRYSGAAAIRAMRQALANRDIFSTGMLLVNPIEFANSLKPEVGKQGKPSTNQLFLHIWCFYGLQHGVPWAAVSFWRGLGLIGKILAENERLDDLTKLNVIQEGNQPNEKKKSEISYRARIFREIILEHIHSARIGGPCHWDSRQSQEKSIRGFKSWDPLSDRIMDGMVIDKLVKELVSWLSCVPKKQGSSNSEESDLKRQLIVRRMHGESIIRRFWLELDKVYLELPNEKWNALQALGHWTKVLERYWTHPVPDESGKGIAVPEIVGLLERCPIPLKPAFYRLDSGQNADNSGSGPFYGSRKKLSGMLMKLKRADFQSTPFAKNAAQDLQPAQTQGAASDN